MDLTSILKGSGTATLIIGTLINCLGYYPQGPILLAIGATFWLLVSIIWKERALMVTEGVLVVVAIIGLSINYLT